MRCFFYKSYTDAVVGPAFLLGEKKMCDKMSNGCHQTERNSESFWNRSSPFLLIQFVIQAVHSLYCQSGDRRDKIKARETHRRDKKRWLSDNHKQTFVFVSFSSCFKATESFESMTTASFFILYCTWSLNLIGREVLQETRTPGHVQYDLFIA